jgi:predicted MFS family arabinose efflux permease
MNQPPSSDATQPEATAIDRTLLVTLSTSAGLAVANNYYNHPMLGHLAIDFQLSTGVVALVSVLTQLGNAMGVLFIAPLGDRLERKRLILLTVGALVIALVAAAAASTFLRLISASFLVGLFATVAQQIVPLSVHIAPPRMKGQVLGTVTGGILVGILLSRTISGFVTEWSDWHIMFLIAAALMLIVGFVLARKLPEVPPTTNLGYLALLGSLWSLLRDHSLLRYAIAVQALIFAAFLAFWSNLAFFLGREPFNLGASAVGLLALAGTAGALAAPLSGRLADKRGTEPVIVAGALLVTAAFVLFGFFQGSLTVLIVGVIIMELGVQSSQVANQARVYALDPTAHSRLNTIFMATMLFGGSAGAGAGGLAFTRFGWTGTCAVAGAAATAGLALTLVKRPGRSLTSLRHPTSQERSEK